MQYFFSTPFLKVRPFGNTILLIILLFLISSFPLAAEETDNTKTVLILFPFNETRDWDSGFISGMFKEIKESGQAAEISIVSEYLRMALVPDRISMEETSARLQRLNEIFQPDVVVSVFPSVHNLIYEYGEEIFPDSMKVFVPTIQAQAGKLLAMDNSLVIKSSSE